VLIQAAEPAQQYFGHTSTEKADSFDTAGQLPAPLYTLFVQLNAHKQAFGTFRAPFTAQIARRRNVTTAEWLLSHNSSTTAHSSPLRDCFVREDTGIGVSLGGDAEAAHVLNEQLDRRGSTVGARFTSATFADLELVARGKGGAVSVYLSAHPHRIYSYQAYGRKGGSTTWQAPPVLGSPACCSASLPKWRWCIIFSLPARGASQLLMLGADRHGAGSGAEVAL
jgi:hypothetical protein